MSETFLQNLPLDFLARVAVSEGLIGGFREGAEVFEVHMGGEVLLLAPAQARAFLRGILRGHYSNQGRTLRDLERRIRRGEFGTRRGMP